MATSLSVLTAISLALTLIFPPTSIVRSPLTLMVMALFFESMTMLFSPVLSMIVIEGLSSESFRMILWPLRE